MSEKKIRVIVADDEVHIRYLVKSIVEAEGFEVVGEANNGDDALALFREKRPDLLLMDINLPGMTGDEVLATVMREFLWAKVVMLTMVADGNTVKRCVELGAVGYILKSAPVDAIRRMVRAAVEQSPA